MRTRLRLLDHQRLLDLHTKPCPVTPTTPASCAQRWRVRASGTLRVCLTRFKCAWHAASVSGIYHCECVRHTASVSGTGQDLVEAVADVAQLRLERGARGGRGVARGALLLREVREQRLLLVLDLRRVTGPRHGAAS